MSEKKKKFREDLKKWVKKNKEIDELNKRLRKIREEKNNLTPNLIDYMKSKNKEELKINKNYSLKLNNVSTFTSVNKNYIINMSSKYFNDSNKGIEFTDFLYNNRKKNEKNKLIIKKKK